MLDILMVTFRSHQFERAAQASLLQYTDAPFQLSVVDNNTENRSLTAVWNEFARRSTAEFLCFANPDIVCGANWTSRLLRAFEDSNVVIASPATPYKAGSASDACSRLQALTAPEVFDPSGQVIQVQLNALGNRLPALVVDDPFAYGYCYCVRRDWLVSQGGFDEAFGFYGQESDLNYRALLAGARAVCVKNSVVYHYGQGSSGGSKTLALRDANERSFALMRKKHPAWPTLFSLYHDKPSSN